MDQASTTFTQMIGRSGYLHCKSKDLNKEIEWVNNDISDISYWATANKLLLNPGKTRAMILGTAKQVNNISFDAISRISIDTVSISFSKSNAIFRTFHHE